MRKRPDWLSETKAQRAQRIGKSGEKKALDRLRAKPVARSGAGRTKGDGRKFCGEHELHIEHKTTEAASFSITRRIRDKLLGDAGARRLPLLSTTFIHHRKKDETWVTMPLWVFNTLINEEIDL
ncbi:hypothetical protein LCGC14_2752630 [marine sediment metagenome]|uniref:Uncharacterized protein n=1 Tax=marine sediment metagenome TaxID=412755 RepID=A0A0F8ZND4_9ZZZZ